MRKGRIFRIVGVGFMLLLLIAVSTFAAAGNAPPAPAQELAVAQDPPVPGDAEVGMQVPEIRDIGHSYDYVESQALQGLIGPGRESSAAPRSSLSPSAIEGLPKEMDWTPVRRVAVHPSNSQILYAAIDNYYGLYRSTTGGQFWKKLPIGFGSGRTIVFASDNTTALASFGDYYESLGYYYNGGVYISTDTGNSWLDVSAGIDYTVAAAAFDPGDITRIYAATMGGGIYRGTYTPGSGVAWTQVNTGLADTTILSIVVFPDNTDILYAGGLSEVWYSTNGGDSWAIADGTYSDSSVYNEAIAVDPLDSNRFYVGSQRLAWVLPSGLTLGGFFKSTTGPGDGNLILKNSGMQETFVLDIAQDPHNSNMLYASTWGSGFFRSDDYGDTWVAKNAGLTLPYVYAIEAVPDPGNPGGTILYAGTFYSGHGLYVSSDRGETWAEIDPGPYPVIFDVTTTYSADYPVVATSRGVRLWMDSPTPGWYIANGLTRNEPGIVLELARHPSNPGRLLAATYGGGIWTSEDAGANWTEASAGIGGSSTAFDIIFSPNDINTAYAGSFGVYGGTYSGGSWSWSSVGTLGHWIRALDAEGAGLPDLYAGTYEAGVYQSPDANGIWTAMNSGLGELRIRSLKTLASSDALIAGTNGSSAWKYTGSWAQTGPYIWAPGVIQIAIHPTNRAIIYAATDQGVYYSSDYGETWTARNKGLGGYGDLVVSGISIDRSNPEIVYLGTWGYGVFKWDIPDQKWVRLSDPLKSSTTYLPLVLRNYTPPALVNGGFEQGPTVGWGQYSEKGWYLILPASELVVPPHSGTWAAWLGGDNDEFAVIWQDVTVPADDPWLRFYHWDASEDACGNDYGYVYVNAGYPYAAWELCASNNTNGWVRGGVNLSAYAGQIVEIAIAADTNGSVNSNLFIDDVTLGSTRLADFGAQEAPRALDPAVSKHGLLPDPSRAEEPVQKPWFLPLQEPLEPQGLLNLLD